MFFIEKIFSRIFIIVTIATEISLGIEKHWLPDLEWETGSNWLGGEVPGAASRVVFPEETWHAVGLPDTGNLEVAEIHLSREGSLYLGRNGALMFSNGNKKNLRTVQWAKKGIFLWIDPDNWNGYTEAAPHAERIPCDRDIVVLPSKNHTLNLALPTSDMHVLAVRIADESTTLNRWEWTEMANRPREFVQDRLTVTYASSMLQVCSDCTCHGDKDEIVAEEVCKYIWQAQKCPSTVCEYPLKVEGHCCEYCGGRVILSGKVSLRKVENRAAEALEKYNDVIVQHVRKTRTGNTEILVAERKRYDGISSQEAVDILSRAFRGDGFEVLESLATGAALSQETLASILGPLLGIPAVLILLTIAMFLYFGYSYSQLVAGLREACTSIQIRPGSELSPKSGGFFGFARFENVADGDVRLDEEGKAAEEEFDTDNEKPSSSGSQRFENPLYRSKREASKDKINVTVEEKIIDVDAPVSLAGLESRVREHGIEDVNLD